MWPYMILFLAAWAIVIYEYCTAPWDDRDE